MEETKVKKKRVYKKFHYCEKCEYKNHRTSNLLSHYLAVHATLEEKREKFPHYCRICEVGVMAKTTFDKHLQSRYHKKIEMILAEKEKEKQE